MLSFVYSANPARIIFGKGCTVTLPEELQRQGLKRPLVITTPQQRSIGESLLSLPGMLGGAIYDGATMHTPVEVTAHAQTFLTEQGCDSLVAIGGGSTIGLSKALALRTGLPQIAIPTTYAGSEVTPILGETSDGVKRTQRAPNLLPQVVIYDVDQTLSLPVGMSASSGLNAIAHAAEALYARDTNPITSLMAEEGIAALAQSLPVIATNASDIAARTQAQYGAWLCGTCLGTVGMALHHKLCHVLGGTFNLPHAETHAIVLPYALAYNASAAPDAMRRIGRALGAGHTPWIDLHRLLRTLQLPTSLQAIGMPASGIEQALDLVLKDSYWNPRPMQTEPLRHLLKSAFEGLIPSQV